MMSNDYIYYGYEIREDVTGFDVFLVWEWHGHFSSLQDAKDYIDEIREIEGED